MLSDSISFDPFTDQYQTWCRGCPQWVDDPNWFSGHMFKGQGQTTFLSPLCCPLNIFWTLYLINTKLGAGVCPQWVDDPYWFSGHMFKVKVKPLFRGQCVVRSISFDPFTWSIPNLVQGLHPISRWSLLIFRSHIQRSMSNHCVVRSISFDPFTWSIPNWRRGCPQWEDDPYWFSGHVFKVQGQTAVLSPVCCPPMLTCFGQVLLLQRR